MKYLIGIEWWKRWTKIAVNKNLEKKYKELI